MQFCQATATALPCTLCFDVSISEASLNVELYCSNSCTWLRDLLGQYFNSIYMHQLYRDCLGIEKPYTRDGKASRVDISDEIAENKFSYPQERKNVFRWHTEIFQMPSLTSCKHLRLQY
jgi:hypothetical protein